MNPFIPDRLEFTLYEHAESTPKALLLSADGHPGHAHFIPRAHVTEANGTTLMRPHGVPVKRGVFFVEEWKAKEVGWVVEKDERQGEML